MQAIEIDMGPLRCRVLAGSASFDDPLRSVDRFLAYALARVTRCERNALVSAQHNTLVAAQAPRPAPRA